MSTGRKIGQSQEKGRSAVSRGALFINALGAVSTGIALIVILVAKFTAGAWITVLLIPALVMLFAAIKRSYDAFNTAIKQTHELDVSHNEAPVVVVPIESWNIMTERALRFGIRLSPDVIAVHVRVPGIIHDDHGDQRADELQEVWSKKVEPMFRSDKQSAPRLEMLDSPYRQIFRPLTAYLQTVKEEYPDRLISVVIPELVETHWFDWLLHNHQATALKAGLLFLADPRIVVINIPWYHSRAGAPPVLLQSESVIPRPGTGR